MFRMPAVPATSMKNSKHNLIGYRTGASQDASGVLRAASDRPVAADSLQDMVKI